MLFKLAAAGTLGYFAYRAWERNQRSQTPVAFAPGESKGVNFAQVRNAGPEAMASDLKRWDNVDQASDESFPASDPASSNRFT